MINLKRENEHVSYDAREPFGVGVQAQKKRDLLRSQQEEKPSFTNSTWEETRLGTRGRIKSFIWLGFRWSVWVKL